MLKVHKTNLVDMVLQNLNWLKQPSWRVIKTSCQQRRACPFIWTNSSNPIRTSSSILPTTTLHPPWFKILVRKSLRILDLHRHSLEEYNRLKLEWDNCIRYKMKTSSSKYQAKPLSYLCFSMTQAQNKPRLQINQRPKAKFQSKF